MIEHHAQHLIKGKLGVQQRRGGEKLIELAQGGIDPRVSTAGALDAREQMGKGIRGAGSRSKNDLIGIVQAKADDVAILQFAAFDFRTIHKQAAALPAILDVELVGFQNDRGALAGDAAVGKLQVISRFGTPANEEGRLGDAHKTPAAIG